MDLLQQAHEWVQRGFEITYIIIDQIENGYTDEVADGTMQKYTYTFSVCEGIENEIFYHSVDSLSEGYQMVVDWLKKNR